MYQFIRSSDEYSACHEISEQFDPYRVLLLYFSINHKEIFIEVPMHFTSLASLSQDFNIL